MGPFTNRMGAVTSPIIAGSSLVLVLDQIERSSIVALSLATGEVKWTTSTKRDRCVGDAVLYERAGSTPQIVTAGGGQYGAHALGDRRAAVDAQGPGACDCRQPGRGRRHRGRLRIRLRLDAALFRGAGQERQRQGRPALARGVRHQRVADRHGEVLGHRDGYVDEPEWLAAWAAVDRAVEPGGRCARQGRVRGVTPRELWRYEKSFVAVVPSPLVLDGLIYTIKNGGILTILKADTGEVVKMGRVGALRRPTARRR